MTPQSIAVNRFGLGGRPDEEVGDDPRAWLLGQVARYQPRPASLAGTPSTLQVGQFIADFQHDRREARQAKRRLADPGEGTAKAGAEATDGGRPTAGKSPRRAEYGHEVRGSYNASVGARVNTALVTDTPFTERLVYFWSNHFALAVKNPRVRALAGPFEVDAIRAHVTGNFQDLLFAAERHPAMLLYLSQATSAGPDSPAAKRGGKEIGLNENLAREIMELHTLGVRSGYTQADVTEFARALTGWTTPELVNAAGHGAAGQFGFAAQRHQPGARTVLGKTYAEGGVEQGEAILRDLAAHPATARHIATKLTRHFAGASEPQAMVDRLADAFTRSQGDLPTVYRALIASPEAWAPQPIRFRTPWEWSIATLRATGTRGVDALDAVGTFKQLAQPVWYPRQPSGWDDDDAAWAAPDALVRRVEEAERLAARMSAPVDARRIADRLFPGAVSPSTQQALTRAESPSQALALLYTSPEMMRR